MQAVQQRRRRQQQTSVSDGHHVLKRHAALVWVSVERLLPLGLGHTAFSWPSSVHLSTAPAPHTGFCPVVAHRHASPRALPCLTPPRRPPPAAAAVTACSLSRTYLPRRAVTAASRCTTCAAPGPYARWSCRRAPTHWRGELSRTALGGGNKSWGLGICSVAMWLRAWVPTSDQVFVSQCLLDSR